MDDLYYIAVGSEQKGPYALSQLQSMWRSGAITADTLYCQQGFDEWVAIASLAQILDGQSAPTALTAQHPGLTNLESDKRILPALILCLFFGVIGIHAFYAGRVRQGILFLGFPVLGFLAMLVLPFGFAGVMPFVVLLFAAVFALGDLIRILTGAYKDGKGRKITKWT